MDRKIVYPGQIPLETDLLGTNQMAMVALGKLCGAILGTSGIVNGLSVSPNTPAALNVVVAPGEIYQLQNLEATAYSSLPADAAHTCMKQGIMLDPVTLACAAPTTAGFSVNYLIEAAYSEVDTGNAVLPFFNASNPSQAYSGPNNTGAQSATVRAGRIQLQAKQGIAAVTGSQVTPAVDAGYIAIAVVTVANGQSAITAGSISPVGGNALLAQSILSTIQNHAAPVVGSARLAKMAIGSPSATASFSCSELIVETASGQPFRVINFNQSVNLAAVGSGGMDTGTAPASGYVALYAIYNPATGASAILAKDATSAVQPDVYGGANMPAGYTASALISVWPTNGSRQFAVGLQVDRKISISTVTVLASSAVVSASPVALNVSGAAPLNARYVSGTLLAQSSAPSTMGLSVLPAGLSIGLQGVGSSLGAAGYTSATYSGLSINQSQTLYYTNSNSAGTPAFTISVTGYEV